MRKTGLIYVVLVLALVVLAGSAWADTPGQNQNNKRYQRNLVCTLVLNGETATITGTVTDVSPAGTFDGMVISYADGDAVKEEKVYGLGPVAYWTAQGVLRPEIGDTVVAEVKRILLTETTYKNVLMSLTYTDRSEGTFIQLRDEASGCPLWRSFAYNNEFRRR